MLTKTPIILLTGFLGSGKTTLLNRIIRLPQFSDSAVIINEFGEVGLDHFLVETLPDQIIEMTSGCLCCTIRGDIRNTLLMLHAKREQGEIPYFQRIIIETTGIANPVPVIQTLQKDTRLAKRFNLAKVICCIDTLNGINTLKHHNEAIKQVTIADTVVLTKTDLVANTEKTSVETYIKSLVPSIDITTNIDTDTIKQVFQFNHLDVNDRHFNAPIWLNAHAYQDTEIPVEHHHDHCHNIKAFCITLEKPISKLALQSAIELLTSNMGEKLLRVKGIIGVREEPEKPYVVHAVQHMIHPFIQLDKWPNTLQSNQLVLITDNIEQKLIEEFLHVWSSFDA